MPTFTLMPNHRPLRRFVSAGVLALVVGVSATACASAGSDDDAGTTTSTVTVPVDGATTGDDGTATDGTTSGGGTSSGGGTTSGGGQPAGPKPAITSFTTPENIDCHNGNFQEFTASWTTTDAVDVTISIDGPGVYNTYPANGETSLPFSCSSSHTFLLTARGQGGQTATKTVTLDPRNVQTPGDEEE